jgi:Ca2+-binding RTX toxin-like protein
MNSQGHRDNLMNPDYTHIGIGIIYGPMQFSQGTFTTAMVTQNFAYTSIEMDEDIPGAANDTPPKDVVASDTDLERTGNIEAEVITGMSGDDTLDGKGGDDTIDGGAGDDFLKGGKGNDLLEDTEGNNKMNGQKGNDLIISGDGDDRLNGGGNRDTLEAGAGDDFLKGGTRDDIVEGGLGNDSLNGNRHDDDIKGGAGDDFLNGGGDNDTLDGGSGNDTLKGGPGEDVFIFAQGSDLIEDYAAGTDSIELAVALAGTDAGDVIANLTTATSDGAVISFGNGNTLEIIGDFTLAQLESDLSFF